MCTIAAKAQHGETEADGMVLLMKPQFLQERIPVLRIFHAYQGEAQRIHIHLLVKMAGIQGNNAVCITKIQQSVMPLEGIVPMESIPREAVFTEKRYDGAVCRRKSIQTTDRAHPDIPLGIYGQPAHLITGQALRR